MTKNRTAQSGRTLLEMLSVLVVIAILLIASLTGYKVLMHKYKKDQTVKQISELAVRYKLRPVQAKEGANIKTIYPEAERASATQMKTVDTDSGRVSLIAEENTSFSVIVTSILNDTCESMLENGDYDAVLATNDYQKDIEPEDGYLTIGREFLKNFNEESLADGVQKDKLQSFLGTGVALTRANIIKKICEGDKQIKALANVLEKLGSN